MTDWKHEFKMTGIMLGTAASAVISLVAGTFLLIVVGGTMLEAYFVPPLQETSITPEAFFHWCVGLAGVTAFFFVLMVLGCIEYYQELGRKQMQDVFQDTKVQVVKQQVVEHV